MSNNNESVEAQARSGHTSGRNRRDPLTHINLGGADVLWDASQGVPWELGDAVYHDNVGFIEHNAGVQIASDSEGEIAWQRFYDLNKNIIMRSTYYADNSNGSIIFYICGATARFESNNNSVYVETSEFTSDNYYTGDYLADATWRTVELIYEYLKDDERYLTVLMNGKHICRVNIGGGYDTYPFVGTYAYSSGNIYIRNMTVRSAEPWINVYKPYIEKKKDAIFILTNDNYVDYVSDPMGDIDHEANNLIAFMEDNSIVYNTFTDISESGWQTIKATAGYILIPELESGNILPDMSSGAKNEVNGFVSAGGRLLMFSPTSHDLVPFLNDIFGFSMDTLGEGAPITLTMAGAALFPDESSTISGNDATSSIDITTLPSEAVTIYHGGGTNESVVTMIPHGNGRIYVFGWDWFNASPLGGQDGGWLHLLNTFLQS